MYRIVLGVFSTTYYNLARKFDCTEFRDFLPILSNFYDDKNFKETLNKISSIEVRSSVFYRHIIANILKADEIYFDLTHLWIPVYPHSCSFQELEIIFELDLVHKVKFFHNGLQLKNNNVIELWNQRNQITEKTYFN